MSQHRSLRIDSVGAKHRNVLKRNEKIKKLEEEGKWDKVTSSAYKLPKVKSMKIKVKGGGGGKEKAAEGAEGAAAGGKPAAAGAAKPAAGAAKAGADTKAKAKK
jgi:small basic protein (TIGR04137 family)